MLYNNLKYIMEEINAPCNSLADEDSNVTTSVNTPETDKTFTTAKSTRKSRLSIPDYDIIQLAITPERKKTLMCTEQNNFIVLHKFKSPKYPKKKFSAVAPTEYSKFALQRNKIAITANNDIRFQYPEAILSSQQIKGLSNEEYLKLKEGNFKINQKKAKTSICLLF